MVYYCNSKPISYYSKFESTTGLDPNLQGPRLSRIQAPPGAVLAQMNLTVFPVLAETRCGMARCPLTRRTASPPCSNPGPFARLSNMAFPPPTLSDRYGEDRFGAERDRSVLAVNGGFWIKILPGEEEQRRGVAGLFEGHPLVWPVDGHAGCGPPS